MPSPTRCLTAGDAFQLVRALAVHQPTGSPRVGLELEWLTFSLADRSQRIGLDVLTPVLGALEGRLPGESRLTLEPGGQVEISTPAFDDIDDAIDAAREDSATVRAALRDVDVELVGRGLDRCRPPRRIVDAPRYRAMEAYFDAHGPAGRTMMCNTAAMQINVDVVGDPRDAWRAAHLVAYELAAKHNTRCPNRLDLWARIDPTRTAPVRGSDPGDAWAQYALDARVMFIRTSVDECVPQFDGATFADWIKEGHDLGFPDEADLTEHLTTLFPPVRPRGWLELRTIDALDDASWPSVAREAAHRLLEHACR